ncbi:MAG: hypothetical protein LBE32_01685 [Burkholderiales bacterium]|jgi:hypothetical protein|nr:hypothetical protein [Burkholderiales bacterium]
MNTRINLQDLLDAFEWVSSGEVTGVDCAAYVSRATGSIHWSGEGIDEELPDDIDDGSQYVAVPGKHELGLGRSLALRFVTENIPDLYERVRQYFRKKGAYSHFKAELDRAGQLEAWREYEQRVIQETLHEWSEEHGFLLECRPDSEIA